MNGPRWFMPPQHPVPESDLGWLRFLAAIRTNALQIWPKRAYQQEVVAGGFFGRKYFLLNAPQAIHRVLVENAANYQRSPASIRILRPIVGNGLLLSEGEDWRLQRRTIAPALAPRVMPLLASHVARAAAETIARLAANPGEDVDVLAAMQFLALEIAARSMFSLEIGAYGTAIRKLIAEFAGRLARPYFVDMMLPPAIPTWHDVARMRFRARWIALTGEIVAARLAAPANDKPRDLFDILRAARDPETGHAFSPDQLRDQVATMIVAGHETTALTLFWSLYLLACAPAEQHWMAEEVCALDLSPDSGSGTLTKLVRTRAVVNEALRLYPPAFMIVRKAVARDDIDGLAIPPGALAMVSPWVLHRHVRLWHDPQCFMPHRFLDFDAAAHRFAYLPFGAGPRVCVGSQFALMEASLVLAMLIARFEIALAETGPVLPVAVVTTQPDRPARFRLKARERT